MDPDTAANDALASTAHWTAAVRAAEHDRDDRLFDDPWAAALAGDIGVNWIAGKSPDSYVPIVMRTRFFDDFLTRIAREGAIRQIVLLGAGLDTRAFRLRWPKGTRVFELDQQVVLERKARILADAGARPQCERSAIAMDLTAGWLDPLLSAGYDAGRPSGWLIEGLLFYLSSPAVEQLLDEVACQAATGSRLGFDIINQETLVSPYTRAWIEMQKALGAPWMGALDDPVGFLAQRGWKAALTQPGQPDANFGRWPLPVYPYTMPNMPHHWLVTAEKVTHTGG